MSSITDKPITLKSEDLLKVEKYSLALSNFIVRSDTPITVGLQGEWGTGKTSLMSLLLEDFNSKNIACSWVNTWEYSMFRGANETTPGVLRGMLEKLKISCKEKGHWTLKEEGEEKFKNAAKFLGGLANQIVAKQTGINIKDAADGVTKSHKPTADIAEIKALISDLIQTLIGDSKNPYQKVVFFVDDLDRIPPGDAVEVLEALKNIFDIPNCVFILAIDYDVVVKGLESKFGPKTEENEREFRSFFDKIIQVPFSMPTGTYDIENFLVEKLSNLGITINETEKELYAKAVKYSIGYNPRSLKRYLNSFSLINHLKETDDDTEKPDGDDFMLFAILGIQISYPKIFRLLTQNPNFLEWNKGFGNKFGVEWDEVQEKIKKFGESELIDEEWEQVTWGACQNDSYLKARAFSVLELLNLIRDKFKDNLEEELEAAMTFASITSVDDDVETKQAVQKVGNKTIYDGIDTKLIQLKEEHFSEEAIQNYNTLWQPLFNAKTENQKYGISLAKTGASFNDNSKIGRGNQQLIYCANPSKKTLGMKFWVKKNTDNVKAIYNELSTTYSLQDNQNFKIDTKTKDLICESALCLDLGSKYHSFLQAVTKMILQ
ncbi:P-loop NTPase fold protein [uncultured Winogradskyella sp.]|uniref:KAP family P-loop NTPase fold protein n=1 Tax=uncultured Winogradskyella sp. TaxID=395353 RepID=UPI0030DB0C7D|tara:strand:- start:62260 stop:64071 length:1812 start_codon:yes stop_codon:yes gene_type:complete